MTLNNYDLSPGVVVNAEDPKFLGRVQCIIAGKTNPDTMDPSKLPWCAPFMSFGYQRISKPMEGQKIWVLHNINNYYEYYYIPMWELNQNTAVIPAEQYYDVLVSRPGEGVGAQSYYTEDQGFVTRIGNDVSSTMTNENTIVHTDNNVEMAIRDGHVYHGGIEEEAEPAILGEQLYNLLKTLSGDLNTTAEVAKSNPYTQPLYAPLAQASQNLSKAIETIRSKTTFIKG